MSPLFSTRTGLLKQIKRRNIITIWFFYYTANCPLNQYYDVIMGAMASQITRLTTVYSTVYSGADQRKRQSSTSLAFVREIHRWPVNYPHKWPVTRKMFPFDDVIITRKIHPITRPWVYNMGRNLWIRTMISVLIFSLQWSQWAQWRLRSPASRLFSQPFI